MLLNFPHCPKDTHQSSVVSCSPLSPTCEQFNWNNGGTAAPLKDTGLVKRDARHYPLFTYTK